jgi:cyclase
MPKFRVIPSVLTDGISQVKGSKFDNWRSVGSVMQAVKVHSIRDVDELLLLDVAAGQGGGFISPKLVGLVAKTLQVPLAAGGGIRKLEHIEALLTAGADKIVLGSACLLDGGFVSEASSMFGRQAIVCSIDSRNSENSESCYQSGNSFKSIAPQSLAVEMEKAGAGELLLQSVEHDGMRNGMNLPLLEAVVKSVRIPVIAGSGASSHEDFFRAASTGAAAVSAGAVFQFTEITPDSVKDFLSRKGVDVRK